MADRRLTPRAELTQARLKELLHYAPETGRFTWLRWGRGCSDAQREAGTINLEGYRRIQLDGEFYQASHLAWLYMTGAHPIRQIDHRDRDESNDRWENLRAATQTQNKANSGVYRNNGLGIKGVRLHRNGQFEARIRSNGKLIYLGCFRTIDEAKAAYDSAATREFGQFARSA